MLLSKTIGLSHSKWREKPSCKNQTIGKLRDPSHFLGPIFVNSKHPFPATKRAFEVNKGRTDVSTSRYERIVKFDKVFVYLCPLVERHDHFFKRLRATHPNSLEIQTGFSRTVWSGLINLSLTQELL